MTQRTSFAQSSAHLSRVNARKSENIRGVEGYARFELSLKATPELSIKVRFTPTEV